MSCVCHLDIYCEDCNEEIFASFFDELESYARSVAEQHGGDVEQIEWHLESQYPELTQDIIYDVIEKVTGNRPTNWFQLVTLPAA